jgi:hypothetical protein
VSFAREIANAFGAASRVMNPEQRSALKDSAQSLAIGMVIVVPLALYLRKRVEAQGLQAARNAIPVSGLEDAPRLYHMRY